MLKTRRISPGIFNYLLGGAYKSNGDLGTYIIGANNLALTNMESGGIRCFVSTVGLVADGL